MNSKKINTINIVWIVNDLYVNNFITVYNECQKNKRFKIKVIASPHIGLNKYNNISSNKVFNFLKKNKVDCINSFKNGQYVDISTFNPDYIFTTTPYDIYLPEVYKSHNLKKIGKLCNVHYGAAIQKDKGMYFDVFNNPYYKNAWCIFTASDVEYTEKLPCLCKSIGYLKLDEYLNYKKDFNKEYKWNNFNKKTLKVIWKPRWTLDEKDSNLLKYLDKFYTFLLDKKNISFVFLYHPLLVSNLKNKKKFRYFDKWIKKLNTLSNFATESSSNFLDCVLSADVLIADHSSTIAEFATTGKPIIYTKTKIQLNNLGNKIMNTAYQTNNFTEIENVLNNLQKGEDLLKINRETAKNSYFTKPPKGLTIAQFLLKTLYDDYNNLESRKKYEMKLYSLNKELSQKLEIEKLENIKTNEELKETKSSNNDLIKKIENEKLELSQKLEIEKLENIKTNEELKETKSSNNGLIKKIELKQNQLTEIEQKYNKIINSNSWKITKPLRLINKKRLF